MKALIILAVVGVSVAFPQSFLAHTPEVQAERQRFFQLYNAAAAAAAAAPDHNEITQQASQSPRHHSVPHTSVWTGPLAATIPAGVDGSLTQVADTPEVIAARQAFESAFQQQLRATVPQKSLISSQSFHQARPISQTAPVQPRWTGPLAATQPAGLPGSVAQVPNTPEVEAAIREFTRAYNSAVVATNPAIVRSTHRFSAPAPVQAIPQQQPRWTGPVAATIPAGLVGSGVVQDTADVAQARAAFDRAFQQQLHSVLG